MILNNFSLFEKLIKADYPDNFNEILDGCIKKKTAFRVNRLKNDCSQLAKSFTGQGIRLSKIEPFDDVYVCDNVFLEKIKSTKEYSNGEIYLQNPSSALPVLVLDPQPNEDILDMAAAPGGKTTQIASLSGGKSNITACERHPMRAQRLRYNLEKQGVKNVNVIQKDARQLEDWFSFDKILLDAPCSGSGTLRINNENAQFSDHLLTKAVATQQALLYKAVKLLKIGGILVYSTCSVLKKENEIAVKKLIDSGVLEVIPISKSIVEKLPTLPTQIDGSVCVHPTDIFEGFFVICLRKK